MRRNVAAAIALVVLAGCQPHPASQSPGAAGADPDVATEIASIRAIDNHAHPVRPVGPGEPADTEYDALPVENLEAASDPIRMRPDSPDLVDAHRALVFGQKDEGYAPRILDQLGIDVMLANRVAMGRGLPADRFLWVPYVDAFMYPLSNQSLATTPDRKAFFPLEEKLLKRYYAESGVSARPAVLDDYLAKVVRPALERQRQGGAVAEKFEMAYLRSLDIANPTKAQAEAVWAGMGDYKALQDYIFRFIAAECGRLGLAVHIHVASGAGSYFDVAGTNPLLLVPMLNDSSLRKTNFVLLHGGWPYTREVTPLLEKPNVYADFSAQDLLSYPADLAQVIRGWLEHVPEKVLFGTDAYPYAANVGWEETGYVAANTARRALGIALTGMLRDGEISRARATVLARMVLRDNARALYKLK